MDAKPSASRSASSCLALLLAGNALLAGAEPAARRTPRQLEEQRQAHLSIAWSRVPLRQALGNLGRTNRLAILLDRRVDPGQPVDLVVEDAPLQEVLARLAESLDLGVSWFGPVVYLGPRQSADILRTLAALRAQEAAQLPAASRRSLSRERPWQWNDLAAPRELIAQLGEQSDLAIEGIESVPHDLWAGADLPPLTLLERLTLVAIQFDLTFEIGRQGRQLTLVPIEGPVELVKSYPAGSDPAGLAERWARRAPGARIQVDGEQLLVHGRVEDHLLLTAREPPKAAPEPTPGARQVHTINVRDKPLGKVLQQIAVQLELELVVDPDSSAATQQALLKRVSFNVREASLDELLRAALSPAGLVFGRDGQRVEIRPE